MIVFGGVALFRASLLPDPTIVDYALIGLFGSGVGVIWAQTSVTYYLWLKGRSNEIIPPTAGAESDGRVLTFRESLIIWPIFAIVSSVMFLAMFKA